MAKELIVVKGRVIEQNRSFAPEVGEDIGYELGAKMIQRWHKENPDDVLASFTGRNIIENILAQPGCTGIRMFNAINDLGIKQLVLVGVDKDGNNILEYTTIGEDGNLIKNRGIVADRSAICPPSCGQGGDISLDWY
ncbi:MAG: hypothetical protein KF781_10410 [Chitinophagaceae bacterium]|nr:hypothetical protein [Chitinophagaceae bacterium]MCW5904930.1 hypothetical protein [Chitinophagaceae bacterium]